MGDLRSIYHLLLGYKRQVSLSLMCHVLMALFTIVSIPMIVPFFHFLFSTTPTEAIRPDSLFNILSWIEYIFVSIIKSKGEQSALLYTCLFIVLIFFLKNLFRYLASFFMISVRSGVVFNLRKKLFNAYVGHNLVSVQDYTRGDMITRLTSDIQEVEWSILRFVQTLFKSPIVIIGSILLMTSINVQLTLFVFVLMIFTGVVIGGISRTLKKSSVLLQRRMVRLTEITDESIDGRLHLHVFRVIDKWKSKFAQANKEYQMYFDQVTIRQELSSPLSEFLGITVVVVLLWYGSQLVLEQALKPEVFFAFVFAFYHVIEPLKSMSTAWYHVKKGTAALDRINQCTLDTKDEGIVDSPAIPFSFKNSISFNNVSFSYGERRILDNVSFKIEVGQKVGIIGPSGVGKSTIIALLLGKLSPTSGEICIDGIPINSIRKRSYFRQIGLVTQRPFLFNDTIRKNLTIEREDIDDARLLECLSIAQAKEIVEGKEEGLESVIGERGSKLSGGEGQRISIARSLLDDPQILLFDEPTSSLDTDSEKRVLSSIRSAMKGRTSIIITHKLESIKNADKILKLKDSKIQEGWEYTDLNNQD